MLDSIKLYFRFAQVPNARLGHIHASMAATLALRICLLEFKVAYHLNVFYQLVQILR